MELYIHVRCSAEGLEIVLKASKRKPNVAGACGHDSERDDTLRFSRLYASQCPLESKEIGETNSISICPDRFSHMEHRRRLWKRLRQSPDSPSNNGRSDRVS